MLLKQALALPCRLGFERLSSTRRASCAQGWRRPLAHLLIVLGLIASSLGAPAPQAAASNYGSASSAAPYLLTIDGQPSFLIGVNYVGYSDRGWRMWEDSLFDPSLIEKDFVKAQNAGMNVLRLFVRHPLPEDVMAGRWQKLDTVVALARQRQLHLLIVLYDYGETELAKVAEVDRRIAERYAGEEVILGYDLKNEPHYQDLTTVRYPPGIQPPLLTDTLIKQYGQRMTQAEANDWRLNGAGKNVVPNWFDSQQNYIYANNYAIYKEFLAAASAWVAARQYEVSTLDYMDSPDANKWRGVIDALDQTLATWLAPRVEAIRSVDNRHPLTVGYSDAVLAKLGANRSLNWQSVHRYPGQQAKSFRVALGVLDNLKKTFPGQPMALTEFGYSTNELDATQAAIYEMAIDLYLLSHGMAGGAKWKLNDLSSGANPEENKFGLYAVGDTPKPSAVATRALADYIGSTPPALGILSFGDDADTGLYYTYAASDALFVAAKEFQDRGIGLRAEGSSQVFLSWRDPAIIRITATARTALDIDPKVLTGDPAITANYRLVRASTATPQPFNQNGALISFTAEAGETYELSLSRSTIDAKIELVWPHGNLPVEQAGMANIAAYLFEHDSARPVCPNWAQPVRLWRSLNNSVEEPVALGQKRTVQAGNITFAAWDFNNVDVKDARDPQNKYYFRLSVDGAVGYSSVWSHGADARTYFPQPDAPQTVLTATPQSIDAKIEIVWPHGSAPVNEATQVNIGVYLFEHGTLNAMPLSYGGTVRLWRSLNNAPAAEVGVGQKTTKKVGDATFPAWEFNNVDVAAARDPANKYYFRVTVDGIQSFSNIWSHGADARTYFPEPDVPSDAGACP